MSCCAILSRGRSRALTARRRPRFRGLQALSCPECHCEETNGSGICLWCGNQATELDEDAEYSAVSGYLPTRHPFTGEVLTESSPRRDRPLPPDGDRIRSAWSTRYDRVPSLLSARAISGFIDLGILAMSTGAFLLAACILSGARAFHSTSILSYSFLFLLVYFLYSACFLGIANRTIGMMITHLRLTASDHETRPASRQIFLRCCLYFLSVALAGSGLIWAFFDPERRCLHDRLTDTRINRM